jgi:hypothetical protein
MKRKRVTCAECETKYRARARRCPSCDEPNPLATGAWTKYDGIVGISLIVVGVAIGIPVALLLIGSVWMGGPRGIRAAAAGILLSVIPIGSVFHGVLLLCGIHPRDFYSWWDHLPSPVRGVAWSLLALLILTFVIVCFFSNQDEF